MKLTAALWPIFELLLIIEEVSALRKSLVISPVHQEASPVQSQVGCCEQSRLRLSEESIKRRVTAHPQTAEVEMTTLAIISLVSEHPVTLTANLSATFNWIGFSAGFS